MKKIEVLVVNKSRNLLPEYGSNLAAGIDLKAMVDGESRVMIYPGKRVLIHTGLYVAIPDGYELQIRPRSGLALKNGITVLNTPGTIDSDYRGEVGVILFNTGEEAIGIGNGDRIAQAVLKQVDQISWVECDELPITERGEGGFGSTGTSAGASETTITGHASNAVFEVKNSQGDTLLKVDDVIIDSQSKLIK